jgi:hypothetical protein
MDRGTAGEPLAPEDGLMAFHPEVMPAAQQQALHQLGPIASRLNFYLGGGTALAIQLGHRRSVDLYWFVADAIADPLILAGMLRHEGADLEIQSVDRGTLHTSVLGVRSSYFEYRYPLLESPLAWPEHGCRLASPVDLAGMKLSAVANRGGRKDLIDIFALGHTGMSLAAMLDCYRRKFEVEDVGHVVMSLTWFEDADAEEMPELLWDIGWAQVKRTMEGWVSYYTRGTA